MQRLFYSLFLAAVFSCDFRQQVKQDARPDIDGLIFLAERSQYANSDTALAMARNAYELSTAYDYPVGIANSSLLMGKLLYEIGGLSPAISQLSEALAAFQSLNVASKQAEVNVLIGKVYQRSENYDQAFLHLHRALRSYQIADDRRGLAEVHGTIGHLHEKKQSYDSALAYQKRALDYYSLVGDTLGLADIHDNLGSIYEDLASYSEAFDHFQMALLLNKAIGNEAAEIVNLNNLGDIYRKTGDLRNALAFTEKAYHLAFASRLDYQVKSASRDLSKIYFELGQSDRAYEFLERSYELTDNIFGEEIAKEIANTQAIYELEQKQQRIVLLEKERKLNRLVVVLSSMGVATFFLLGGLTFFQQRSKNDKKRRLLETEAELTRAELENSQLSEQKLKTELENKMLREEQLKQELELKSKSLTKSALHMIQKNEFLHVLRNKLKDLKKAGDDNVKLKIKKLIKSIDLNFNLDDDWQEFETIFQQVHSEFFLKLKELYPNLSPSEVRLCAMIRLNLHSKDMAAIMGISQDSLRIARYRLRKSLGLNKGANLYAFIINIG